MNTNTSSIDPLPYPGYIPYDERAFSLPFLSSLIHSFLLTFIAELGDKTFIMLIILQLKANQTTIFFASLFAQLGMNSIAMVIGFTTDYMLYKNFIDYIGIFCFFIYSIWLIGECLHTSDQSFEKDLDIIKDKTVKKKTSSKIIFKELTTIPELTRDDSVNPEDLNVPLLDNVAITNSVIIERPNENNQTEVINNGKINSKIFWTIFASMALSECGDRTQISSMTMAAIYDFYGVLCGSCLALFCTVSMGVYGGKFFVKILNEKILNFLLGVLFLAYAMEIFLGKKSMFKLQF